MGLQSVLSALLNDPAGAISREIAAEERRIAREEAEFAAALNKARVFALAMRRFANRKMHELAAHDPATAAAYGVLAIQEGVAAEEIAVEEATIRLTTTGQAAARLRQIAPALAARFEAYAPRALPAAPATTTSVPTIPQPSVNGRANLASAEF